jgi:hypothetical protein
MKKLFALPLAVVFIAACSDSTAPTSAYLSPRYAKPAPTPTGFACNGTCNVDNTFDFSGGISAAGTGTATVGTELQVGAAGTADAPNTTTSPSGQTFLGRFTNTRTDVVINIPAGNSIYSVTYDLYIIGSWDGRGKQAQHGVFDANVYDVSYRCNATPGTVTSIFQTSFSNQLTVQQDYPLAYLLGGNKAGTGSFAIDALNYRSDPTTSNTPVFRSYGDVEYKQSYSGTNRCGTGAFSLIISTSNPTQQSVYDESWGIDNVHVQADS